MKNVIQDITYLIKVSDATMFISNIIEIGLDETNVLRITKRMTSGIEDILNNPRYWKGKSSVEEINKRTEYYKKEIFNLNFEKTCNYKKLVINYGIILLNSIFEEFLQNVLEVVLKNNPKFTSWNSYNEISEKFKKIPVGEKLGVFKTKLKLPEDKFMNFELFNDDIQKKYSNLGFKKIIEIDKKRTFAAHTDKHINYKIDDFYFIQDLYSKLILNITYQIRVIWGVSSEMLEQYKND